MCKKTVSLLVLAALLVGAVAISSPPRAHAAPPRPASADALSALLAPLAGRKLVARGNGHVQRFLEALRARWSKLKGRTFTDPAKRARHQRIGRLFAHADRRLRSKAAKVRLSYLKRLRSLLAKAQTLYGGK